MILEAEEEEEIIGVFGMDENCSEGGDGGHVVVGRRVQVVSEGGAIQH